MASPDFLSDGHTPNRFDSKWEVLQKILGALNDISGGGGGGGPFVQISGDTMTGDLSVPDVTITANGELSDPAFSVTGTPITGGTATTTKPLVLIETAGATSTSWSTAGTMLGVNAPSGFGGNLLDLQVDGSQKLNVTAGGSVVLGAAASFSASSTGDFRLNNDTILSRKAAANWQLGTSDAAAPVAQTLSVQSVSAGTTDTVGQNWTFAGSRGTGTGAGGELVFQTAAAGSTGSSQNALVSQLRISSQGGIRIGGGGSSSPWIYPCTGASDASAGTVTTSGIGLALYSYVMSTASQDSFVFLGRTRTPTSGSDQHVAIYRTFAPTSGTASWVMLGLTPTINQTGGANGITRGLYVNPTLTAAADFRAIEVSDGNVVLPKTVTAGGTTGNQTINKLTGSVNFAAAATSLTVTNSYVTTDSIITATVATNDATMKTVLVVASAGSFVIHANAAAAAETRVNFKVTN